MVLTNTNLPYLDILILPYDTCLIPKIRGVRNVL